MNPYDLWRYFGPLPPPPEIAYTAGPGEALARLSAEYRGRPGNPAALAALVSFALRFSRLDGLRSVIDDGDWTATPTGRLYRGRLGFLRALAERPDNPDASVLGGAVDDFRAAAEDGAVAGDAMAALVRIHAVLGDWDASMRALRRLIRAGGRTVRPAAAGACFFLADYPGVPAERRRGLLRRARRLMRRSGRAGYGRRGERIGGTASVLALVERRLGRRRAAFRRLESAAAAGDTEARCRLLLMDIDAFLDSPDPGTPGHLFEAIARYKKERPSDARAFIAEGDLLRPTDAETAGMAWRSALVLDERHAGAWSRLGDLYRAAWETGEEEFRANWLEAAGDAYAKAVSLDPLDPYNRTALGMVERDAGRPARAVAALREALALDDGDETARRWLAMSWLDLSYSPDLDRSARMAAAGRSLEEWRRLLSAGKTPFDILGYARALVLEGGEGAERERLFGEITAHSDDYDAEDLVILAEDCVTAGEMSLASAVLDAVEPNLPDYPRIHGLRGEIAEEEDPAEAVRRYLKAAGSTDPSDGAYVDWLIAASASARITAGTDGAEAILRAGLGNLPDDPALLRTLASLLSESDRPTDAFAEYRTAVRRNPDDIGLLEDAVWFGRESGAGPEAEGLLRAGLERRPEDPRLWNQLGVHLMETGWNEADGSIRREALDGAIAAYRKAVELIPENRVYLGNLGDALRQAGSWTEAADLLHRAVDGPNEGGQGAFALNSLARLEDESSYAFEGSEEAADDWDSAGEHYRRAVGADGGNVDFRKDYAWWLYRERRLEESLEAYLFAEVLDPADDSLPYGAFCCRRDLGDEAAAAADLDRALALMPDDPVFLADKADLIASLGDAAGAEAIYGRALDAAGGAAWVWERLAGLRERLAAEADGPYSPPALPSEPAASSSLGFVFDRGRTPEGDRWRRAALEALQQAVSGDPGNKGFMGRLGALLMDLGEKDEARKMLEASLVHGDDPGDAGALDRLGRLDMENALKTGSGAAWKSAGDFFASATRADSLEASYHADAGYLHWALKDHNKAAEAFLQAHDREPGLPEYAANAGICAASAGRYEEAEVLLRRALALGDESGEWQNALGLVLMKLGETTDALEAFRKACLADPARDVFAANLAMAHSAVIVPDGPLQ